MSECIVPSWNLTHQRQEIAGEEGNRPSSHVHNQPQYPSSFVVPMSNYEVAELTWENGQLAMHGLTGILPAPAVGKVPTFGRAGDTLESVVQQATTCYKESEKAIPNHQVQGTIDQQQEHMKHPNNNIAAAAITEGKRAAQNTTQISPAAGLLKKRFRSSESADQCGKYNYFSGGGSRRIKSLQEDQVVAERSACASASATFCRDANMMTWNSFESPGTGSFKTKTTDEDSDCHDGSENREEDVETKEETFRSDHSARRSRAAMIHNQSERRRRDRINQKMKALQKLVPNASKTDKASMLDEVIDYLKQLQTQVHMMSTTRTMAPQMMMNPLAAATMQLQQQQQLHQMSLLARMGMGVGLGLGMLDMNDAFARSTSHHPFQQGLIPTAPMTPTFVPPHFVVPATAVPTCNPPSQAKSPAQTSAANTTTSVPFSHDPYSVYLAQQSMNMDFYNKMAALYRQQATNQGIQTTSNPSEANFIQRD